MDMVSEKATLSTCFISLLKYDNLAVLTHIEKMGDNEKLCAMKRCIINS